jgi:DMSO/TMAO reductase YedYZ molybdopterin-dependent catalytic subunit
MDKKRLIILVIVLAAIVGLLVYVGTRGKTSGTTKVTVTGVGTKAVTPTAQLHVRTAEGQPKIDLGTYRLKVTGLVGNPLSLTFDEVKALPSVERYVVLPCVEGWSDRGIWKGVKLTDVLSRAGVQGSARTVVFKSPGGYTTSLTTADVKKVDPILAYGVNGVRLPDEQGYPVRLVVPHKLGYKWIKWVTEIDLIKGSYSGYWESQGYSNSGDAGGR